MTKAVGWTRVLNWTLFIVHCYRTYLFLREFVKIHRDVAESNVTLKLTGFYQQCWF